MDWLLDLWTHLYANWLWLPLWLRVTLLVVAIGTFAVYTAFPLVYAIKGAQRAGVWMPKGLLRTGRAWLVIGAGGNAVYNIVVGTARFRDLPRELAYSQRIQRYIDEGSGWRYEKALPWARLMNWYDPKPHITGVPK